MSIIKTLSDLAYGEAVADYDTALRELAESCVEHQKPGELTITLKLIPSGGQLTIHDTYKLKIPEKDRQLTIMYLQRDGNLGRRDPRQPELPFREVPKGVDPDTGEIEEETANG